MKKNELRKKYSVQRKELGQELVHQLSADMCNHFSGVSWGALTTVLSYAAIQHHREFDASCCENLLRKNYPRIRIAHPRILQNDDIMEAVEVFDHTIYSTNHLAILEPSSGTILTPESFDLVLTPLLAFDEKGFRVGYGKGFYDRWLAQCRPGVIKVGFSFFAPVDAIGDINEFDVPLDYCITPTRVYEF